jgi:hypothetical protein
MYSVIPQPKIRNGAYYYDLLNSPTTSHLSSCIFNDTQKYTLSDATFSIQLVTNSWKYDSEVQFVAWSRQPPKLKGRAKDDSEYYRFEAGYLPASHETAEMLRDVADKIDIIMGYSNYYVHTPVGSEKPKRLITEKTNLAELL